MNRVHAGLTGPPQTMLATLYAKALDADAPRSILGDQYAKAAVACIDYDWETTTITARRAPSVVVRTAHFDNWTRQFLAVHSEAVVLHVGCGLDARVYRLDPGSSVRWYDVDYPEVIALRERVNPGRANYRMLPASVVDPSWLAEIPAEAPALFLAEGLTMYLTKDDGLALLRRVVDRFASGELQFDAFNAFAIRTQVINGVVRRSGSRLNMGHRRTRRYRRRRSRGAPIGVGVGVRQRHVRPGDAVSALGGQGDGGGAGPADNAAVSPLCVRVTRRREALSVGRCCTNHLRLRRYQPWPTGKS